MKIVTVVGARPQFIKASVVSRKLRQKHREIFVHTGQHFDRNMSDVFFSELDIPLPDYQLGISGGSHAQMTAKMMLKLEPVLQCEQPDWVLLYGDTNSTLAAALTAVKLQIPVAHVEAGARLGVLTNPEEINRICTDHVSTLLMTCTASAQKFLEREALISRAVLVGDPMYDAFVYFGEKAWKNAPKTLTDLWGVQKPVPKDYNYLTCHRQENTANPRTLIEILNAMQAMEVPAIYPVHPRNHEVVKQIIRQRHYDRIIFTEPLGYLSSIALIKGACRVVTDSGGVQREAFFAGVPCVTVFNYVVWPETMRGNWNQLARADAREIIERFTTEPQYMADYQPFGDGRASEKIVAALEKYNEFVH